MIFKSKRKKHSYPLDNKSLRIETLQKKLLKEYKCTAEDLSAAFTLLKLAQEPVKKSHKYSLRENKPAQLISVINIFSEHRPKRNKSHVKGHVRNMKI